MKAILYKDFTVAGRRWQTYLWRSVAMVILGLILCWVYGEELSSIRRWGLGALGRLGHTLNITIILVTFALAALGVPAAVIRGILEERDRQTMGLLIASPMLPWRIAVGKTLAAVGRSAISLVCVCPFLFIAFSFGGTEVRALLGGLANVAAIGCLGAAVALGMLSTRARGSVVIIGTYAILIGYSLIPLILVSTLGRIGIGLQIVIAPLVIANPFLGCLASLEGNPGGGAGILVIAHPGITLGSALVLLGLATALFAWRLRREADLRPVASRPRTRRTRPISKSPVHWYETRIRLPGRVGRWGLFAALGFVVVAALSFLFAYGVGTSEWLPIGTLLVALVLQVLILVMAAVMGAWTGGDPRGEVPLLVAPISMGGVALQKIRSVLSRLILGLALLAALLALAASHDDLPTSSGRTGLFEEVAGVAMVMASTVLMVIGLAALGALLARATASSTRGTVGALGIFFGQAIAVPSLLFMLRTDSELAAACIMALDPLFMTPVVLVRGLDDTGAVGLAALVLEAFIVGGLLLWTLARWGDLSRRKG